MESLHIDDRVMVRAELVRVKQQRAEHARAAEELDLETGRVIRKARDLGVAMEEATSLVGLRSRTIGYKLVRRLEESEKKAAAA